MSLVRVLQAHRGHGTDSGTDSADSGESMNSFKTVNLMKFAFENTSVAVWGEWIVGNTGRCGEAPGMAKTWS